MFKDYTEKAQSNIAYLKRRREYASPNDLPKIDLAINLVRLRTEKKTGQTELARALGINQKNVCQWERGEVAPSLRYLIALANFYGVTVDQLLTPCN